MEDFATWIQIIFSGALAVLTYYLAKETKRLADASLPNVIAKIIPNKDLAGHFNLVVVNCGGSPAYDVQVAIRPELPIEPILERVGARPTSFSVILPEEQIEFHGGSVDAIMSIDSFDISMSWSKKHHSTQKESRSYTQHTSSFNGTVKPAKRNKEI